MPSVRDVLTSPDLQGIYGCQIVRQTLPNGGACSCLATVLRHFGMYASERMLVDSLVPNSAVGVSPEQLIEVCANKSLMASGFTGYPGMMIVERAKCGHFTLIRRQDRADHWMLPVGVEVTQQMLVLADPGQAGSSFSCLPIDDFLALWERESDVAITIDRPRAYADAKGQLSRKRYTVRAFMGPNHKWRQAKAAP